MGEPTLPAGPCPALLIVTTAGRALAQSARRAGYLPLVIDDFGDLDTLDAAQRWVKLPRALDGTIDGEALCSLAAALTPPPMPLVWGSCFDDAPELLEPLAQGRLAGTSCLGLAQLKEPRSFAALCAAHGLATPEIARTPPVAAGAWLVRRRGGTGGVHIRRWQGEALPAGHHLQREVVGRPISAALLVAGEAATVLAWSEGLIAASDQASFRFGGLVAPAALDPALAVDLGARLASLARAAGVRGLASADGLLDEVGRFWLLEINPRPGASLDVLDMLSGTSLLPAHLAACAGRLSPPPAGAERAAGIAVAYAGEPVTVGPIADWPSWLADRARPGTRIATGVPLCTVRASGATPAAVRELLEARSRAAAELLCRRRPGRTATA